MGEVRVPGDKSIAHRCLMLGALASGDGSFDGMPRGADVQSTVRVLRQLGVSIASEGARVHVFGRGIGGLLAPKAPLDCGNSGTTMRLLAGLLAGARLPATLTGDASLRRRPMERIAEPLRAMGARVSLGEGGRAPVVLGGGEIRPVTYRSPVASAQVKSCVLLAGLGASGSTCVIEPRPTRDHTERMLRSMGASVQINESICLQAPAPLQPLRGTVPGDASSAAYWVVSATLASGSDLLLSNVGMNPGRRAVVDLLERWGARIRVEASSETLGEPVADLRVQAADGRLTGGHITPEQVPGLIDELPLLGLLAPSTRDGIEVRGAAELRVKESDRIRSTCDALRALGAQVEEYPDGFAVKGATGLTGGQVDADGDHRIALATAAVSVAAGGEIEVIGAAAADVSYPRFLEALEGVRR